MRTAMNSMATRLVPKTRLVPDTTEKQAVQEFSAVVLPFSIGELAQASNRSKEAAKAWKEGRSLPSAWSLLAMSRKIPAVRNWVAAHGGFDQFNSPEGMDRLVRAVHFVAAQSGTDADDLREILSGGG